MRRNSAIRLGKISSINFDKKRARVLYEDQDRNVTAELPFLSSIPELPQIGDLVVTATFTNGGGSGVILGTLLTANNRSGG